MKTYKDMKDKCKEVADIKCYGFNNAWVLRYFARQQALLAVANVTLLQTYMGAKNYVAVIAFLLTGEHEGDMGELVKIADDTAHRTADDAALTASHKPLDDTLLSSATKRADAAAAICAAISTCTTDNMTVFDSDGVLVDSSSIVTGAATTALSARLGDYDYTEPIEMLDKIVHVHLSHLLVN